MGSLIVHSRKERCAKRKSIIPHCKIFADFHKISVVVTYSLIGCVMNCLQRQQMVTC
nr:MAG TPA: hypothetical protein [Bacteriophage sp.]